MDWYNYTAGRTVTEGGSSVKKTGEEGIVLDNNGAAGGYSLEKSTTKDASNNYSASITVAFE